MKYIDYTGRWLKLRDGNYTKIVEYDSIGYAKTENEMNWDLHFTKNQTDFKRDKGEELMPENWHPQNTNYEIY